MRPVRAYLIAGMALGLTLDTAQAQHLRVHVSAADDGRPLTDALVRASHGDAMVGRAETDSTGVATLTMPHAEEFELRVSALGYAPLLAHVYRGDEDELELSVTLATEPLPLGPLVVTGDRRSGPTRGRDRFRAHHELGEGIFLDRADLDTIPASYPTELLAGVEGLKTTLAVPRHAAGAGVIPLAGGGYIVSEEGWGCMRVLINDLPPPEVTERDLEATNTLLDTRGASGPDSLESLDMLSPDDIEGVEIYRDISEVPPEHRIYAWPVGGKYSTPCGLVVFWTRGAW